MDYPLMVFDNDFEFFNFNLLRSYDVNEIDIRANNSRPNIEKIKAKHIINLLLEDMKAIP
jgi:hypothetical protein